MANRSKVLQTYKCSSQTYGGVPNVIRNLAKNLCNDYAFTLLTTKKWNETTHKLDYIKEHFCFSFGNLFSMPISPTYILKFALIYKQYDIILHHHPFPLVDIALLFFLKKKQRLIIYWHSDIVEQKFLGKLIKPLIKYSLKKADKIIVSSIENANNCRILDSFKHKVTTIPFAIDENFYRSLSSIEKEVVQNIQKKYGNFILFVGRLVKYKGLEYLIRAMQQVSNINLVIIGHGPLAEQLSALVKSLKLNNKVFFEHNVADTKAYFHASQFFVLPSISTNETFGIVQLEAMACGKAIINTQLNNGVNILASHNAEAITVQPGSVKELSNAINKLLKDEALRTKLATNGYKKANTNYSNAVIYKKYKEIFITS